MGVVRVGVVRVVRVGVVRVVRVVRVMRVAIQRNFRAGESYPPVQCHRRLDVRRSGLVLVPQRLALPCHLPQLEALEDGGGGSAQDA